MNRYKNMRYTKYLFKNPSLEERRELIEAISLIDKEISKISKTPRFRREIKDILKKGMLSTKDKLVRIIKR